MEVINMKIENDYPKISHRIDKFLLFRKIVLITFFIAMVASIIVNISIGGKKWCLYVVFGEIILYFAFFNKPLVDNILIKKISILLLIIIGYLLTIDWINDTNWSYLVIDILSFSLLIVQLIFFFINYDYHKNKIILMLYTSLLSVIFSLMAIIKVIPLNWAIIVTGSIGGITLFILFTFYFKTTILELKKYFSLK